MSFSSSRIYFYDPQLIPAAVSEVTSILQAEGYQVQQDMSIGGMADLSICKGGMFKAILGLKTSLKVAVKSENGHIRAEVKVGIWGQNVIPAFVGLYIFTPVLLTQAWGLVRQSQLDDYVLDLLEKTLEHLGKDLNSVSSSSSGSYCPECGASAKNCKFCPECGMKL